VAAPVCIGPWCDTAGLPFQAVDGPVPRSCRLIRRVVLLQPQESARIDLVTGVAEDAFKQRWQ